MKQLIFLFIIFSTLTVSSQLRRNNPYPNTNNNNSVPELKPENVAGLLEYETKKTCKKISVKQKSELGKKVVSAIEKYNKSIRDITRINKFSLDDLKNTYKSAIKKARENGDMSQMNKFRQKMALVITPIRKESTKKDSILTLNLKSLLNKKQFKKWIRYSNNIKKRANPIRTRQQPVRSRPQNRRRGF
ncbi:MAG: hypothetical protein JXQ93_00495 [Flavobacteriaceae bacterium]